MKARQFAPAGPIHEVPGGSWVDPGQAEEALTDALRGVEMGAYDELIKAWFVRHLDLSTLKVLVSLLERTREVAIINTLDLAEKLDAQAEGRRSVTPRRAPGQPGNSGPGFPGPIEGQEP